MVHCSGALCYAWGVASILEQHRHPRYPRLKIQLRKRSRHYQAIVFLDGRKLQHSLRTDQLTTAFKLGEEWYKRLLKASISEAKRHPLDKLTTTSTIGELFASYRLTLAQSRRDYADMKWSTIADFWRTQVVTDVNAATFREFYKWRRRHKTPQGTTIKNLSLHKDMMVIRQVLKYAIEEEHLHALPPIPKVGKIEANPRPWFTRDEWDHLMAVCVERMFAADKAGLTRVYRQRKDLEDFLNFLLDSMMRVGELRNLTAGQCRVVPKRKGTPEHLIVDVVGKVGHRTVVAGELAAAIYADRSKGLKPAGKLFPHSQRDSFRELLDAADLRRDAFGMSRNLKSVRATSISFAVLRRDDLMMIARNAGTSVAMIDNFYARRLTSEMSAGRLAKSLAAGH
jgi:hypothetical protein